MPYFNIVAETNENTVVTEYTPVPKQATGYQSEAELEQEFIRHLQEQGYEYLTIHAEKDLIANLRRQTGIDFTCTFDGTNADADGFVQLGDMIQCKLTCPARLRGFGDFLFPVTLQAESRARSRVYRK